MGKALIISLNFNPGHVSHMVAGYRQYEELGYEPVYCVAQRFVDFLPAGSRICVYGKDALPVADLALFVFPSEKNLGLIRTLKRQGARVIYIFHEPLGPLKDYKEAGFSYKYLAKLWLINRINALTVKWSDEILLPSRKALELYKASRLYKNANYHYLPLLYDDERIDQLAQKPRRYFSYIGTVAADHSFSEYLAFVQTAVQQNLLPQLDFLIATRSEFEVPEVLAASSRVHIQKGRPLTDAEINEAYASSYVIWNAYARTTQSGVLAKSFMFGTPAIVLRKNLSEFVEDGKEVVAIDDNTSIEQIASAIQRILDDFPRYSAAVRARFEDTFYYKKYNAQMARRTLWMVTELFYPSESATAYILTRMAQRFARDFDVKVICADADYEGDAARVEAGHDLPGMEIIRVPVPALDKNSLVKRLLRFVSVSRALYGRARKEVRDGDLVFAVTNPAFLVLKLEKLRRQRNIRYTLLVHDVFPENALASGVLPGIKPLYSFLKKRFDRAYATADKILALGEDMKEVVASKTGQNDNIFVLPNWGAGDIVPAERPADGKLVLQYAGNIGRVQGIEPLLELIVRLHNPALVFDFWGSGALVPYVKQFVKEHGLQNVQVRGSYGRAQQNAVLNDCDLALIPLAKGMKGLGVPSKTYSVLAAGKPILYIGDKGSEIYNLVQAQDNGYAFDWESTVELEAFLNALTPDALADLAERGKRSRALYEQSYTEDSILEIAIELLTI